MKDTIPRENRKFYYYAKYKVKKLFPLFKDNSTGFPPSLLELVPRQLVEVQREYKFYSGGRSVIDLFLGNVRSELTSDSV